MIHSILIFRGKTVIHYEPIGQSISPTAPLLAFSPKSDIKYEHNLHLIMGMISGISGMITMLSGADSTNKFESFTTPEYRLDYYETVTGYKFIVMSTPNPHVNQAEVRADFDRLYQLLFVPLVIRNPLFDPLHPSGELRDACCNSFLEELPNHFRSLLKPLGDPYITATAPILQVQNRITSSSPGQALI